MPEKTQLFIAKPCGEEWGNMQSHRDGRFCGSCQKKVVDFTMMSDQEVLTWLSGAGKDVCGRFTEDQLNRDLSPAQLPKRKRWAGWHFLLTGLLLTSEVSAQEKAPDPPVIKFNLPPAGDKPIVVGGVRTVRPSRVPDGIRLQIVDSATGESVPGATVQMDKAWFSADHQGRVSIALEKLLSAPAWEITAVGYRSRTLTVNKSLLSGAVQIISLSRTAEVLGEATVVSQWKTTCRLTMGSVFVVRKTTILQDTLAFLGLSKAAYTIYPNPVSRGASVTISFRGIKPGAYLAQMFSASGVLVETMRVEGVDGPRTELMNIPETLAAGVYFVRLLHEQTGKAYTEKVEVL